MVHGLSCSMHVGSSQTKDRTCVPCIGRQILNHCTTREVPLFVLVDEISLGFLEGHGQDRRLDFSPSLFTVTLTPLCLNMPAPVCPFRAQIGTEGKGSCRYFSLSQGFLLLHREEFGCSTKAQISSEKNNFKEFEGKEEGET